MRIIILAAAGLVLAAAASASFASDVALKPTKAQLAAVSDANRPKEDVQRDAERKPADMLAFAGVKPGDKVADLIPGKGYFTRLFADVVGPKGVVYAYEPSEFAKFSKSPLPANGAHPDPARPNIVFLTGPANDFATPQKLDIVWTSQNYHDLKDSFAAPADIARVNKAVFAALRPGGRLYRARPRGPAGDGPSSPRRCTGSIPRSCARRSRRRASSSTARPTCCAIRPIRTTSRCSIPRSAAAPTSSSTASASRNPERLQRASRPPGPVWR